MDFICAGADLRFSMFTNVAHPSHLLIVNLADRAGGTRGCGAGRGDGSHDSPRHGVVSRRACKTERLLMPLLRHVVMGAIVLVGAVLVRNITGALSLALW
jgi:hypothetical protein